MASSPSLPELLQRWHAGDPEALDRLVEACLPWLRDHVERRLGAFLRGQGEVGDYLQDALLDFLRDGPRFVIRDEAQLRGFLKRVVENTLRDKNDWFRAKRRHLAGERVDAHASVLDLQSGLALTSTPSRAADREEQRAWVRMALELLEPEDRKLIVGREYEQRSYAELAADLGIATDAARMRWNRAMARLGKVMLALRSGRLGTEEGDG